MTRPSMTLDRFQALLAAYGTHLERWSAQDAAAARELLLSSREARAAFDAEKSLDALLDAAAPPPELPSELLASLARIPERTAQGFPFRRRSLLMPALGWAAAAVIGLWAGARFSYEEPGRAQPVAMSSEASVNAEDDALVALAAGDLYGAQLQFELEAP